VVVGVTNTVLWTNNDNIQHTVTSTSVPNGAKSFDSGLMSPGKTFQITLTVPGTYGYYCKLHPTWMKGTIDVIAKP
jgi:plastocyanin